MNLCRKTEIFLKQNLEPPIIYCFRRLSSILYFLYLRECQESDSKIPKRWGLASMGEAPRAEHISGQCLWCMIQCQNRNLLLHRK